MPRLTKIKRFTGSWQPSKTDLRELSLYAENDGTLYRSTFVPFAKNYAKKIVKGTYNQRLAIKGLADNAVPRVLEKYGKDNGTLPSMSNAGKKQLGQILLRYVLRIAKEQYVPELKKKAAKKGGKK